MNRLTRFFNTFCVFTGSLLRMKPIGWKAAESFAGTIAAVNRADLLDTDGTPFEKVTPFGYLIDSVLNLLALALCIWLVTKIISGFFIMLPYMVVTLFVLWVISKFLPAPKGDAAAS